MKISNMSEATSVIASSTVSVLIPSSTTYTAFSTIATPSSNTVAAAMSILSLTS
jgi:hypothetical protein